MKIRSLLLAGVALTGSLPAAAQSLPWHARLRLLDVHVNRGDAAVAGSPARLSLSAGTGVELAIAYAVRPDFSLELSALRTRLDVDGMPTASTSFRAGTTDLTLLAGTLQYEVPLLGRLHPYLGAGLNFASFSSFDPTSELAGSGIATISFGHPTSATAQLGADFDISEWFSANLEVKYHRVVTDAVLRLPDGGTWGTVRFDISPWTVGIGVGARF